jgi:hypothetical protein
VGYVEAENETDAIRGASVNPELCSERVFAVKLSKCVEDTQVLAVKPICKGIGQRSDKTIEQHLRAE